MERYGVFKKLADGSIGVAPASDLNEAKVKMLDGALRTGLEHFVYDFTLGQTAGTSRESSKPAGSAGE